VTEEGERMRDAPAAIDLVRLDELLVSRGFPWAIGFRQHLKRLVSFARAGDKCLSGEGQPRAAWRVGASEMARAPC
jgi:hypothetical protein